MKRRRGMVCLCAISVLPLSAEEVSEEEGGTGLGRRRIEILDGIARYAPWDCPERWLHELGGIEERNRALRRRMLSSASWVEFLAYANALDWSEPERKRTRDILVDALPGLESGKIRQNVIFLLLLTGADPAPDLRNLLERKAESMSEEDRKDLLCALAALGDEQAIEWFSRDFQATRVFVGRPIFEFEDYVKEEQAEKNREPIRAYRFWEALFREPYFKRLKLLSRSGIYGMNAREPESGRREALITRLLPLFTVKWPGHPGSDDCALRLMNHAIRRKDLKEIYIWAQRASLLPDEDCSRTVLPILKALADSQLGVGAIEEILASEDGAQNRDFLRYQRFLLSARENAGSGIEYFDRIALSEKDGVFAMARRSAAGAPPSPALRDGIDEALTLEILRLYPERSRELGKTPYEPRNQPGEEGYVGVLSGREQDVVLKTRLRREHSIGLDATKLGKQYRLIVELENLRVMEERETDPEIKADLRYRRAKLFYRESAVFFPVWADEEMAWGWSLNAVRYDAESNRRLEDYAMKTFAMRRAHDLLASILVDYPGYRGNHSVLFHMAQAYAKLLDYKPAKALDAWTLPDRPPQGSPESRIEHGHRRVGELFRRIVEQFPASPWADEAEKGSVWRLKMANLLQREREKVESERRDRAF